MQIQIPPEHSYLDGGSAAIVAHLHCTRKYARELKDNYVKQIQTVYQIKP